MINSNTPWNQHEPITGKRPPIPFVKSPHIGSILMNPSSASPSDDGSGSLKATRNPFSIEEDRAIMTFAATHGPQNWSILAAELSTRTAKQCRERWRNHLNPKFSRAPWTAEEDRILAARHRELGNRWAKIAAFLPSRSEALVKNRWHNSVKNRLPEIEADARIDSEAKHGLALLSWSSPDMKDFNSIPPFTNRHPPTDL
jgi:hypothetical protein